MACPFPGMDPYLEDARHWPRFRKQFLAAIQHILQPALGDRYKTRIGTRSYVTEMPLFTSIVREQHAEESLEIRHRGDDRLITLIDIVSPINRTTTIGRAAYLETRRIARANGGSLVEIDLVTQGQPMLDYARDGLPDADYTVSVSRHTHPDRFEIYAASLRKRLPRFKLPLAADDRDTVLDLQSIFTRSYEQSGFLQSIDYKVPPQITLRVPDDSVWVVEMLTAAKLR